MHRSDDARKPAPAPKPAAGAETPERAPFVAPELQKRGTLPAVTTAFGGSFTP